MRRLFLCFTAGLLGSCATEQDQVPTPSSLAPSGIRYPVSPPDTLLRGDTLTEVLSQAPAFRLVQMQKDTVAWDSVGMVSLLWAFMRETVLTNQQFWGEHLRPYFGEGVEVRRTELPVKFVRQPFRSPKFQQADRVQMAEGTLLPFTQVTPPLGQVHTSLHTGLVDKRGRVWLASEEGLHTWTGKGFFSWGIAEGLPTGTIFRLAEDGKGRLWITGSQGISYFWEGHFYRLVSATSGEAVELSSTYVVADSAGDVFVGLRRDTSTASAYLFEWHQEKGYQLTFPGFQLCLPLRRAEEGLWCSCLARGTNRAVVGLYREGRFYPLQGWEGRLLALELCAAPGDTLWIANREGLWLWTKGKSALVVPGKASHLYRWGERRLLWLHQGEWWVWTGEKAFPLPLNLPREPLSALLYRPSHREWLTLSEKGSMGVLHTAGPLAIPLRHLIGKDEWAFAVAVDSSQRLWIGTEQSGLYVIHPTGHCEKLYLSDQNALPNLESIYRIEVHPSQGLWIAWYGKGAVNALFSTWLEPNSVQLQATLPFKESFYSVAKMPQRELWWLTNGKGLYVGQLGRKPQLVLQAELTSGFFRDNQGRLWIGGKKGQLYCWTGSHLVRFSLPDSQAWVLSLTQDQEGKLWVGTHSSGVYRWEGEYWRAWGRSEGLAGALVAQLTSTGQWVLAGTEAGLSVFQQHTQGPPVHRRIYTGYLGGVNGGRLYQAHAWQQSPTALLPESAWLSGMGTSLVMIPQRMLPLPSPPQPYFAAIQVGESFWAAEGEESPTAGPFPAPLALPATLELPHGGGALRFVLGYQGPFAWPQEVEYSFRLGGAEEAWSPPTPEAQVVYQKLAPGTYTLEVRARYAGGPWSEPVAYSFRILPPWWLSGWAFLGYGLLLAAGVWGVVRWRTAALRRRAQELAQKVAEATQELLAKNQELAEKNSLLEKQNQIISEQKSEIEAKNADLLSSISYAQRIQKALLPSFSVVQHYLPNSFLFWQPRDIVSGDVYGVQLIQVADLQRLYLLVADCTGHGVPGAFVSLLTLTTFTRTLTEYGLDSPDEIFTLMAHQLTQLLHPDATTQVRDGFEGVLLQLEWKGDQMRKEITYAAARSPFWLARQGEVIELKADPHPVGPPEIESATLPTFTRRSVELQSGDWVYLSSDGFPDQIGGPRQRKFGYKAFRALVAELSSLPAPLQAQRLAEILHEWRGPLPQVDDVLVIGFQVP